MLDGVTFQSRGCRLVGGLYRADGSLPRPTALLAHGIPGVEKNLDLAYALRDLGWNCLYFHYRGSWGSAGDYSLPGIVEDTRAAVDFLAGHPAVDGSRLVGIGMSLGGWGIVVAAAQDERLRAAVSICPLVDPAHRPLAESEAEDFARLLQGITGPEVQAQWAGLTPLPAVAGDLRSRPLLVVYGSHDEFFSPEHTRLLLDAAPWAASVRIEGADHLFSSHRRELVTAVTRWLATGGW